MAKEELQVLVAEQKILNKIYAIRGEKVMDFAARGKKGHKLVPAEVVLNIETKNPRVMR